MEFACIAFRIYLMLCICNGIQIPSGIFFQAIGKSVKSAILSLSRQIVFLIPALIILGNVFGIGGILYAGPLADGLAFILAVAFLALEIRSLNKNQIQETVVEENTKIENKLQKHIVITISREYGSGGRYIGELLAKRLGIKFYDKEFITTVAKETGLTEEYVKNNEQRRNILDTLNNGYYFGLTNSDEMFIKESELIKRIANKESCVIIGRCADFILSDMTNVIKIFVYSDMKDKINRATKYYGLEEENAEKEINRINKLRANHYKYYTGGKQWNNYLNYDICINSDKLGAEKSAELIENIINDKTEAKII